MICKIKLLRSPFTLSPSTNPLPPPPEMDASITYTDIILKMYHNKCNAFGNICYLLFLAIRSHATFISSTIFSWIKMCQCFLVASQNTHMLRTIYVNKYKFFVCISISSYLSLTGVQRRSTTGEL